MGPIYFYVRLSVYPLMKIDGTKTNMKSDILSKKNLQCANGLTDGRADQREIKCSFNVYQTQIS